MNSLMKFALSALMAGSAAIVASPSNAAPPVLTHPPRGDQARPCRYFVHRHLPAPRHCYRFLSNIFGPEVYVHGGYVFRDRQAFLRWHERHAEPMGRFAEREDRMAEHANASEERREERLAAREQERSGARAAEEDRSYQEDREDVSGGAARGPGSVHEMSGGATRGERAEQSPSGGATRGERIQQHASGGASGY